MDGIRRSLLLSCIVLVASCEQTPQGLSSELADHRAARQANRFSPLDLVDLSSSAASLEGTADVNANLAGTTVVSIVTAPGPDGLQGTTDDIHFDAAFTPRYQRSGVNYASPTGQEWSALGVTFQFISGAEALTIGANGCLGSQLPAPALVNNWDGGVRVQFVGPGGVPAVVTRVSVDMVTAGSRLDAYDQQGNLLGSQTLSSFRGNLTVSAPGIARVDLNGHFWCIGTSVEFDNLTYSIAGVVGQIAALASSGEIDPGVAKSLESMLTSAEEAFARGSRQAGLNILTAFMNHVSAQTGVHITSSAAALLQAWAQAIATLY